MKHLLFLMTPLYIYATATFITPNEYATHLYKDPRGIGCNMCHGENGEGKLIAKYKHKGKEKSFRGPKIDNIKYNNFYKTLNKRNKGMPRYFLTDKEIEALYLYLHKDEKKEKKNVK